MTTPLLEVRDLDVIFGHGARRQRVLHSVNLAVAHGQAVGLVGESGSGKSTMAKAVVGTVKPAGGKILVGGVDVSTVPKRERVALHRRVQLIPQDPYSSLNPRMRVGETIAEAIDPRRGKVGEHRNAIIAALERVALDESAIRRYPSEFSGGQRQRIAIARALAVRPDIVIADEITSALDCSVQAEVLSVLRDLRAEMSLTILFISHDLAVVRHVCDEIAVLERGYLVERAPRDTLFGAPSHDYTKLLLASVPDGSPVQLTPASVPSS